ncbi:MAG: AI-2E family transporter [Chordicoccus sp.]
MDSTDNRPDSQDMSVDAGKKPAGKMRERIEENMLPRYTRISIYVIVTVLIIYVLMRLLDHFGDLVILIAQGLHWLGVIFKPLAAGFAFAYLLYPAADFFERKIDALKKRLRRKKNENLPIKSSRGLAVAITWLIVAAVVFIGLSLIVSTITSELKVLNLSDLDTLTVGFANTLKQLAANITSVLNQLNISSAQVEKSIQSIGTMLSDSIQNMASNLLANVSNITHFFSTLLFAIIFGIYFMLDGEGLKRYWGRAFRAFAGPKVTKYTKEFIADADRVFSGYVRGQLMDALFMAVVVSISLSVIGIKYAVIIGILTGIGNLIPYVGPFVAYGSTALVCLLNWNLEKFIVAICVLFIIQTIDGNVINPKFLSHTIHIHPVLVIVSLLIGSKIGGLIGMLVAVPCGGLAKVYFEKLINYRMKRKSARA